MILIIIKKQLLIETINANTENIDIFKIITVNAYKIEND